MAQLIARQGPGGRGRAGCLSLPGHVAALLVREEQARLGRRERPYRVDTGAIEDDAWRSSSRARGPEGVAGQTALACEGIELASVLGELLALGLDDVGRGVLDE